MIRVVILQKQRLDCDSLAALIRQTDGLTVVAALTTDWEAVAVSRLKRPDVVIVDSSLPNNGALSVAASLLNNSFTNHVVFLGDVPADVSENELLRNGHSGCLSRSVSHDELASYIKRSCTPQNSSPEANPEAPRRVDLERNHRLRVEAPEISGLSRRESEVFRLLADGNSVRQSATLLGIAANTLDNHKSRIMKKLGIHKTVDLVRIAIREGIIEP